ncbi:otoancorin [Austrofundulus limnaeus]|uniref:Otoancorin n=1 Tax=Austrofundulus limnaeus TaxID=52670 RepID=A0A2I4CYC6_AUSLI|nr:PREDICTED: otoancorin [Austrofundulus limnaeus]
MSPQGGPCFLMLTVFCTVLAAVCPAVPPDVLSADDASFIAKKLMMKCSSKGYPEPTKTQLNSVFNSSNLPVKSPDQTNTFLSTFLQTLGSVTGSQRPPSAGPVSVNPFELMKNNLWNCSNLPTMIKTMKNFSNPSVCYMEAFIAPLSWAALTSQTENFINSSDYDTLLAAAKPVLVEVPSARTKLPTKIQSQNLKKMMNLMKDVYDAMAEDQRTEVFNWVKDQILQNNFSCTLKKTTAKTMSVCKPTLKWLDLDALNMIGPYSSSLPPNDLDSASSETLCGFFSSGQLKSIMSNVRINPGLAKTFLQKIQPCLSATNVDKLGPLACYYEAPKLTPDLSRKLLSQLGSCESSITSKLKKDLISSVLSGSNSSAQDLMDLGQYVTSLTPKQLRDLPQASIRATLQNVGSSVNWSPSQLRTLAKNQLGDKKCSQVTAVDVMSLQSAAAGLSSCALKNIRSEILLNDSAVLTNITRQMKRGQLKAMLNGLGNNVSVLLQKLSGPLLRSVSLSNLGKANISRLEDVENKTWSLPQAAFLAKRIHDLKKLQFRRLNSIVQGITCKMMDEVNGTDALDMTQAIADNPDWLSKAQAGCAARKLFQSLEQVRPDYFKKLTEQELTAIPALLLIHLPPGKLQGLPDSVCQVFLNKMETANLSSLPLLSPSRRALSQRAVLCLTIGKNLSDLSSADVSRLGPLLCEVKPSDLALLDPQVVPFSLQAMASCRHVPQQNRADLVQLLVKTFGSPSNWTADTVELLGPLLLLDDSAVAALPNQPWLKDVLLFLKPRLSSASDAFRRKCFELSTNTTITPPSNPARRRRAAVSSSSISTTEPSPAQIQELGLDNVYWTAAQLDMMSNSTFQTTVEVLGSVSGYTSDQLDVLQKKAVKAFGPVSQMSEGVVVQLGCITQGFSNSDLETLQLPLDSLDDIANCGWKDSQIPSMWKGVAKYNNLTAGLLGAAELVGLNRFLCGLNSSEILQLSVDAFRDAVGSMSGLQCPTVVLQQLKQLAVSVFGSVNTWTEAQVSALNSIMAGLNAAEMSSLDPSVFSFFNKSCISQIPPQVFAALSAAQLEALGPDNAAMVTHDQRAALTPDQVSVLNRAESGAVGQDGQQSQPVGSGAPELREICTFMKLVLFLLIALFL